MLTQPTLEKMEALKLYAMAEAWLQQQKNAEVCKLSFDERLGLLVDAESLARETRLIKLQNGATHYTPNSARCVSEGCIARLGIFQNTRP